MKFKLSTGDAGLSNPGFLQIVIIFVLILALILYGPDYIRTGVLIAALSLLFFIFVGKNPMSKMNFLQSSGDDSDDESQNLSHDSEKIEDENDADMRDTSIRNNEGKLSGGDLANCTKCQIDNPYLWMSNPEYSTCYQPVQMGYYNLPENDQSYCNMGAYMAFDEANARMTALRQRDKKTLDGWATKNVNFYKKHFGRELNDAEHQRWWGNDEY